ncbi:MAG TPA: carboxypeptidase-like regulatory domain-containing protein, partial [Blastocatellia bacterium]
MLSTYSRDEGHFPQSRLVVMTAFVCLLLVSSTAYAQSTYGTVLGTVKDPSGSAIPKAIVELLNVGTNSTRTATTNENGNYQFVNVDQGMYQIKATAPGFDTVEFTSFEMAARDTKRFDADLKVATQATVVTVEAASVLQTETSSVAYTKGSLELTNLPVAIGSRSTGSTSAFSTLTAQPGVQIDSQNNITVAGATTSQLSFSIDGISSVGPGATAGPLTELFPSFNAIEEIRISENLNPAEYGGVADVTTVSKSGTNAFHGGAFENLQNNDFNAADTFSHTTPVIKLNDFGIYLGGPVILPKIYDGHNKTFFFGSFERL